MILRVPDKGKNFMFSSITKCTNEMFKGFVMDVIDIIDSNPNRFQISVLVIIIKHQAENLK